MFYDGEMCENGFEYKWMSSKCWLRTEIFRCRSCTARLKARQLAAWLIIYFNTNQPEVNLSLSRSLGSSHFLNKNENLKLKTAKKINCFIASTRRFFSSFISGTASNKVINFVFIVFSFRSLLETHRRLPRISKGSSHKSLGGVCKRLYSVGDNPKERT